MTDSTRCGNLLSLQILPLAAVGLACWGAEPLDPGLDIFETSQDESGKYRRVYEEQGAEERERELIRR